jgi:5-methylcytosine-specific restriction enzyme subunit McrC
LAWASVIVDEKSGSYRFRDFTREPKRMARLYESFILNFLRHERPDLDIRKEKIAWAVESATEGSLEYLPGMETDISVRDRSRTLIIEAKYYEKTLSTYYEAEKLRSGHLYQLFSYLKNLEARGGADSIACGVILYPTTNEDLCLDYTIHGHRIGIRTIDLALDWREIRESLLGIVTETLEPAANRVREFR